MKRNKYSTPKGDILVGATFTVAQIRNAYSENGGPLTPRRRRFLRTFIPPYLSDGTGAQREFAILMPLSKILEKAPPAARQRLRNHFSRADEEWFAARPWIGNPDNQINPALIDNELGGELDRGWSAGWDDEEQP